MHNHPAPPTRRWTALLLTYLAFCGGVLWLAYANILHTSGIGHGIDKVGHFVLIGLLAYLAHRAADRRMTRRLFLPLPVAPAAVLILVTLEEIAQQWSPNRTADTKDWLADVAGVACAMLFDRWWLRRAAALAMKNQTVEHAE